MKNERQQSDVNVAIRISRKLASSGVSCSCGIPLSARISAWDTKLSKNRVGAMANNAAMPPVSTKLTISQFTFLPLIVVFTQSGSSITFFNASIPSKGMVNSAITSIEATVRNLAYIGQ